MHKNTNFINIGERTNITGSLLFKKLILDNKFDSAVSVAKDQIENGAQIIDINMDEGLLVSKNAMINILNIISSEPDPHIILLKLQLNFLDISNLNLFDLLSGYLDKTNLLFDKIFLTFGLMPKADSFAESFIIFLIFLILDFPGL